MANQSDSLDHASEVEEVFREKAIAAMRKKIPVPSEFDGSHCVDCEIQIPPERLALGKFTCVPCQELIERGSRLYGRK